MNEYQYDDCLALPPKEMIGRSKKNGRILCAFGDIIYKILKGLGFKSQSFFGICEYFEMGSGWGGLSLGTFFICSKTSNNIARAHELGHMIQNAKIGDPEMSALTVLSAIRYWKRKITGDKTPYDSWWFEGQATEIGLKYLSLHRVDT